MTDTKFRVTLSRDTHTTTTTSAYTLIEVVAPDTETAEDMGRALAPHMPDDRWIASDAVNNQARVEHTFNDYFQAETIETQIDPHVTMVDVSAAIDRIRGDLNEEEPQTDTEVAVWKARADTLDQLTKELAPKT